MSSSRYAYALLTTKAIDEADQRVLEGTATTPETDRVGDIINPLGVKYRNPLPLLWMHDAAQPVGEARFNKPTADGITFRAKMAQVAEPPSLRDRLDDAWGTVKAGLVKAVSIGFRPLKYNFIDGGGIEFDEVEVLELSLVTIPAHAGATLSVVKSFSRAALAASGRSTHRVVQIIPRTSPGASGTTLAIPAGAVKLLPGGSK